MPNPSPNLLVVQSDKNARVYSTITRDCRSMHNAILVPFGIRRVSIKFYKRTTCFEIMFKNLTASFLKLVQWQPQPNNKIQLFYVKFVIHIGPCSIVSPMVSDSNFTLTVHSPKLNQAKTHFLSHLGEKREKIWLDRDLNP